MLTALDLRAGMAVVGVSLGGLAIGGAVALVTAPLTPHLAVARPAPDALGRAAIPGSIGDGVALEAQERTGGQ